jgi:hypothetical protein
MSAHMVVATHTFELKVSVLLAQYPTMVLGVTLRLKDNPTAACNSLGEPLDPTLFYQFRGVDFEHVDGNINVLQCDASQLQGWNITITDEVYINQQHLP